MVTNPPSGSTHTFPKKRTVDPPTTSSASKPNFSHQKQWAKKTGNRISEVAPSFIADTSQEGGTVFCSVPRNSCERETYSLSESMGENYHGLVDSVSNFGGLHLQFLRSPPLSEIPISLSHTSDKEKRILLSKEVQSLILKGAIERVQNPFQSPGFYSRLVLVPKITGGMKPVIDLSILNTFLLVPHFKMDTNRSIRSCIHPGMWGIFRVIAMY